MLTASSSNQQSWVILGINIWIKNLFNAVTETNTQSSHHHGNSLIVLPSSNQQPSHPEYNYVDQKLIQHSHINQYAIKSSLRKHNVFFLVFLYFISHFIKPSFNLLPSLDLLFHAFQTCPPPPPPRPPSQALLSEEDNAQSPAKGNNHTHIYKGRNSLKEMVHDVGVVFPVAAGQVAGREHHHGIQLIAIVT